MANEPRTLCDVFQIAASCGKPNLLISKVNGEWKPISAADFGFTVRALSLGLNGLGVQPGDRVAILSENRPEWAMADYAIALRGGLVGPDLPDAAGRPDHAPAERLRGEGDFRVDAGAARQDPHDQGAVPDPRPRDPRRGQSAGRAGLHHVSRRRRPRARDPRDEPGRLRAARGAREARRRRDDHLHLGHDGGAQGRDAHALQPGVQRRYRLRGHPVHGGRRGPLVPAALARLRADARLRLPLQDGLDRVRRVDRQARGELHRSQPDLLRRRAPCLREGARQDHGQGRRRQSDQEEDLRLGRRRRARNACPS